MDSIICLLVTLAIYLHASTKQQLLHLVKEGWDRLSLVFLVLTSHLTLCIAVIQM